LHWRRQRPAESGRRASGPRRLLLLPLRGEFEGLAPSPPAPPAVGVRPAAAGRENDDGAKDAEIARLTLALRALEAEAAALANGDEGGAGAP